VCVRVARFEKIKKAKFDHNRFKNDKSLKKLLQKIVKITRFKDIESFSQIFPKQALIILFNIKKAKKKELKMAKPFYIWKTV